ncbi:MAG TPA: hypothetical protein VJ953_20120 [Saprospiraceae bacterium]|nr:hypothetical protein [Saprospiraceae bacterium]
MKIIFSRKGFDSSYGGGASPIMPNGDLLSIPIPSNAKVKEQGIPYRDLHYGDSSYLKIMKELGLKIPKPATCHLDPDLLPGVYPRPAGWRGIFGQHGAALSHLNNEQVEVGDLFLFFGSFKRTVQKKTLQFERDHERHILFGYLRVNEILIPGKQIGHPVFSAHPHFQNDALYQPRNQVYIGQDYGTFRYDDRLVLTKNGFKKSYWELPPCFHSDRGCTISRHKTDKFEWREGKTLLRTIGIGQDFVVKGNEEIKAWAEDLLTEVAHQD